MHRHLSDLSSRPLVRMAVGLALIGTVLIGCGPDPGARRSKSHIETSQEGPASAGDTGVEPNVYVPPAPPVEEEGDGGGPDGEGVEEESPEVIHTVIEEEEEEDEGPIPVDEPEPEIVDEDDPEVEEEDDPEPEASAGWGDSCAGVCGEYAEGAQCQCDPECFEFGDCCEDACAACAEDASLADGCNEPAGEAISDPPDAICAPGATRCVAGDITLVETCSPTGDAWLQAPCGEFSMCSDKKCWEPCGSAPGAGKTSVCFVPNKDGVNNGIYFYSSDMSLLGPGTLGIVAEYKAGKAAKIYKTPKDKVKTWPYEWKLPDYGDLNVVEVQFTLDQFPGQKTKATLGAAIRREEPPGCLPQVGECFWDGEAGLRRYAYSPTSGSFVDIIDDGQGAVPLSYLSPKTISAPAFLAIPGFDLNGGINAMGLQTFDIFSSTWEPFVDSYVSYVELTIE